MVAAAGVFWYPESDLPLPTQVRFSVLDRRVSAANHSSKNVSLGLRFKPDVSANNDPAISWSAVANLADLVAVISVTIGCLWLNWCSAATAIFILLQPPNQLHPRVLERVNETPLSNLNLTTQKGQPTLYAPPPIRQRDETSQCQRIVYCPFQFFYEELSTLDLSDPKRLYKKTWVDNSEEG